MGIRENLARVEENIRRACEKANRNREDVTLIAVSKTHPADDVNEAVRAGQRVFGENRVQELKDKAPHCDPSVIWHLIGTLQSNKVKYLPHLVNGLIHSVDNVKLAQEIDKRFETPADVLIEVNMAHEETKMGLAPENVEAVLREIAPLPNVRVRGLMTIAPFTDNAETNRVYFAGLRELMERLNRAEILDHEMRELSMGMSGDYPVAIEEGATLIRVGTAIFGARNYT